MHSSETHRDRDSADIEKTETETDTEIEIDREKESCITDFFNRDRDMEKFLCKNHLLII